MNQTLDPPTERTQENMDKPFVKFEELQQTFNTIKKDIGGWGWLVVADGSGVVRESGHGTTLHAGGWATAVTSITPTDVPGSPANVVWRYGGQTGMTTYRAEFTGLLEGLRVVLEDAYEGEQVLCLTDCDAIVQQLRSNNRRAQKKDRKHSDLWLLWEYYSSKLSIEIMHIKRTNTLLLHNNCDLYSAILRAAVEEIELDPFKLN